MSDFRTDLIRLARRDPAAVPHVKAILAAMKVSRTAALAKRGPATQTASTKVLANGITTEMLKTNMPLGAFILSWAKQTITLAAHALGDGTLDWVSEDPEECLVMGVFNGKQGGGWGITFGLIGQNIEFGLNRTDVGVDLDSLNLRLSVLMLKTPMQVANRLVPMFGAQMAI